MRTIKSQKGLTVVGFFMLLTVIGFVSLIVIKMAPTYMQAASVYKVFSTIQGEKDLADKGPGAIRKTIRRRFSVNTIKDIELGDNLVIEETKDGYDVSLSYQKEVHLLLNVDVIMRFKPSAKVNRP